MRGGSNWDSLKEWKKALRWPSLFFLFKAEGGNFDDDFFKAEGANFDDDFFKAEGANFEKKRAARVRGGNKRDSLKEWKKALRWPSLFFFLRLKGETEKKEQRGCAAGVTGTL